MEEDVRLGWVGVEVGLLNLENIIGWVAAEVEWIVSWHLVLLLDCYLVTSEP